MKKIVMFMVASMVLAAAFAKMGTATSVLPTSNYLADSANTALTMVFRDSSGNFSAGTITASLTGTATAIADASATTAKLGADSVTTIKILLTDQTAGKVLCITTAKSLGYCSNVALSGACASCN